MAADCEGLEKMDPRDVPQGSIIAKEIDKRNWQIGLWFSDVPCSRSNLFACISMIVCEHLKSAGIVPVKRRCDLPVQTNSLYDVATLPWL